MNDSHSRRTHKIDVSFMVKSFPKNGYMGAQNTISVPPATAPEIQAFLEKIQKYSMEQASKVAAELMKNPDRFGYCFAYDGLIRKKTSLQMKQLKELDDNFMLDAVLLPNFS